MRQYVTNSTHSMKTIRRDDKSIPRLALRYNFVWCNASVIQEIRETCQEMKYLGLHFSIICAWFHYELALYAIHKVFSAMEYLMNCARICQFNICTYLSPFWCTLKNQVLIVTERFA